MAQKPTVPADTLAELMEIQKDPSLLQTPEERQLFEEYKRYVMEQYDPPLDPNSDLKGVGSVALDMLNYGAGIVQLPIGAATAAGAAATGKKKFSDVFRMQDVQDALNPLDATPAPSLYEYADRAGVPKGPSLSSLSEAIGTPWAEPGKGDWNDLEKGGMLDVSLRNSLLFPVDMATSPSLWSKYLNTLRESPVGREILKTPLGRKTLGPTTKQVLEKMTAKDYRQMLKDLAEIRKQPGQRLYRLGKFMTDPIGNTLRKAGRGLYETTFREADDAAAAAAGRGSINPKPSQIFWDEGFHGSPRAALAKAEEIAARETGQVSALIDTPQIRQMAPKATRKELLQPAKKWLQGQAVAGQAAEAQSAWEHLKGLFEVKGIGKNDLLTLKAVDQTKKAFQGRAKKSGAYKKSPVTEPRATRAVDQQVKADLISGGYGRIARKARELTEDMLDEVDAGIGGDVARRNAMASSLYGAMPALSKEAKKPFGRAVRDSVPFTLTGAGLGSGLAWATGNPWAALLAGSTGLALSLPQVRRKVGMGVAKVAAPALNVGLRPILMHKYGEAAREPSPWTLLEQPLEE